jgi:chromosome segregation ATPase
MSSHLELDSQSYSTQVDGLRDRIAEVTAKYDAISIVRCLLNLICFKERDTMQWKGTQAQTRITYLEDVSSELEGNALKHSAVHKSTLDELELVKAELDSAGRAINRLKSQLGESGDNCKALTRELETIRGSFGEMNEKCMSLEAAGAVLNTTLKDNGVLLNKSAEEMKRLEVFISELENGKIELGHTLADKSTLVKSLEEQVGRLRVDVKERGDSALELESATLESGKTRDEERTRLESKIEELTACLKSERAAGAKHNSNNQEAFMSMILIVTEYLEFGVFGEGGQLERRDASIEYRGPSERVGCGNRQWRISNRISQ